MKNVAVLTEDRAFALLFRPHPWGFDSSRVPTPENLLSKPKKNAPPARGRGGTGRSWNWLMHYEGENFSDSSFHHIFESENFRFPFFYEKYPNLASEMWNCKIKLQKIVANFIDKVIDNSRQYLLLRLRYLTVNSRWVPLNRQSLKYYRLSETSWKIHRGIPLWFNNKSQDFLLMLVESFKPENFPFFPQRTFRHNFPRVCARSPQNSRILLRLDLFSGAPAREALGGASLLLINW